MRFALRNTLVLLWLCLLGANVRAQRAARAPVRPAPEISAATVERVVRALAADAMQGRGNGQPGGQQAARFLSNEFRRIGLQPLPGATGFEQRFTVYQTKTEPLSAEVNGQPWTAAKTLVLAGQPTLDWRNSDAPPPAVITIGPDPAELRKLTALLHPAANTLVFMDKTHAKLFGQLAAYYGQTLTGAEPPAPFATVFLLGPRPATLAYHIRATTAVVAVELRNIVGTLPGHEPQRAQEPIIFSAHYDHLGFLPPVAGDSIANGADDDASGTAAVVALAEYYKRQSDNARPLLFVAFAAEEVNNLGSQYFARQLNPKQVVAMLNIEMIGKVARFGPGSAFVTGFDKSDMGQLLQAGVAGSAFRFEPDPYPAEKLFYRSDNASLARRGVPAHSISTDQLPTDKRYHSVADEVASLDLPNLTAVVRAIALGARGIVRGQQTPTRLAPEAAASK